VFGETAFWKISVNDQTRERILLKKGWRHISVIYDGGHNPIFVRRIVDEIVAILPTDWVGKRELR